MIKTDEFNTIELTDEEITRMTLEEIRAHQLKEHYKQNMAIPEEFFVKGINIDIKNNTPDCVLVKKHESDVTAAVLNHKDCIKVDMRGEYFYLTMRKVKNDNN